MEYSPELFTAMPICTFYVGRTRNATFVGCISNITSRANVRVFYDLTFPNLSDEALWAITASDSFLAYKATVMSSGDTLAGASSLVDVSS